MKDIREDLRRPADWEWAWMTKTAYGNGVAREIGAMSTGTLLRACRELARTNYRKDAARSELFRRLEIGDLVRFIGSSITYRVARLSRFHVWGVASVGGVRLERREPRGALDWPGTAEAQNVG